MSATVIIVQSLKAGAGITAIVGNKIYPFYSPQEANLPLIVTHLITQPEEELLQGASQWPEARVSVECRASEGPQADRIAERVIEWLRDKHLYVVAGFEATFRKEGTDLTDSSDDRNEKGQPYVTRRIVDFYIRYRQA